jgi:hypothetical protein
MHKLKTALRWSAGTVLAVGATMGIVTPASAAVDPIGYQHVDVTFGFNGGAYAGNYVSCPAGTSAIASGEAAYGTFSVLTNDVTTFDGYGAYGSGFSGFGDGGVQVSARCVASSRLAGNTVVSGALREHRTGWHTYVRTATCPTGTLPYGGGSFVNGVNGYVDLAGLYDYASFPSGQQWYVGRAGDLGNRYLWTSTHCLPRAKLGSVVVRSATTTGANTTNRTNIAAGVRCPDGYFAYSGGAYFHAQGDSWPVWKGYLQVNTMSADERGWYAKGLSFEPNIQLTAVVNCTTRLG